MYVSDKRTCYSVVRIVCMLESLAFTAMQLKGVEPGPRTEKVLQLENEQTRLWFQASEAFLRCSQTDSERFIIRKC